MNLQNYLYIFMISFCLLANIFNVAKYVTPNYIKTFIPFLLISLILEVFTTKMALKGSSTTNIYNLSTILEICFYLWVLSQLIEKKMMRIGIVICQSIYTSISLFDIYINRLLDRFHSITYSVGGLFIVFFTIVFFYQLFNKPKAIFLTQEPSFWICTALLLFYSVTFPLFALVNFMSEFPPIITNNLQYVLIVLNVFLYLLFSIAFLCRIKIKKS